MISEYHTIKLTKKQIKVIKNEYMPRITEDPNKCDRNLIKRDQYANKR